MALTNFNIEPYNDDFDANNRFYKILFRPSFAVQARELTQIQSIIQNQIKNFGEHIFKEGSMVIPGSISINLDNEYVRLQPKEGLVLSSLVGSILYGNRTGLKAEVINYSDSTTTDPGTLFVKYLNTSTTTFNDINLVPEEGYGNKASRFIKNEELKLNDANGDVICQVEVDNLNSYLRVTGKGSSVIIQEGVYFIDGYFVNNSYQELILDKYFNTPSYKIGFNTSSRFITAYSDQSLNDNASGVTNTNAPGADRYTIDLTLTKKKLNDTDDTNFVKLLELKNGIQEQIVNKAQYNILEETLARRTHDESGNYIVNQFDIDVREHRNSGTNRGIYLPNAAFKYENRYSLAESNGLLALGLSPGKAYVYGYEIENPNTKYITISKAREYDTVLNSSTNIDIGNYFEVTDLSSLPDIGEASANNISSNYFKVADLRSYDSNTQTYTNIGKANIKFLQYKEGNVAAGTAIYKLGVFNLTLYEGYGYTVNQVTHIQQPGSPVPFTCRLNSSGLYDTKNSSLVYKLPQKVIKTLQTNQNNLATDIIYTTQQTFVAESQGTDVTFTLSQSSNQTFTSLNDTNYSIVKIDSSGNTITPISATDSNVSLTNNTTLVIAGVASGDRVKVHAIVTKSNPTFKTKTIPTTNSTKTVIGSLSNYNTISLNEVDIIDVIGIYMTDDFNTTPNINDKANYTDITDRYILDNGQKDSFYDFGSVFLKSNASAPTGSVIIEFRKYQHSSAGDFFCADSYPDFDSIPEFTSSTKGKLYLRDCIDFRPAVSDSTAQEFNNANIELPENGSTFSTDFEYYLPRIDSVGINSSGKFVVSKGVPSIDPQKPNLLENTMIMYYLYLPAYTYKTSDVKITAVDNRRYTMRDIGKLEKRIKNVEYYTQLSLLEQNTLNTQIQDSNGLDRFKNGIIVDNFKGHNIGDVTSSNYFCSIDMANGELRPEFIQNIIELSEKNTTDLQRTNAGYKKTGELITLPYTSQVLAQNTFATKWVNCNPFLVFQYVGDLFLTPDVDEWFDTQTLPDLVVSNDHLYDSISSLTQTDNNLGTIWNNWQTEWSGVNYTTSTDTFSGDLDVSTTITVKEETQTRTGISRELAGDSESRSNFGERVVNTSYIPFIRSRTITFTGKRLKPNTRVYAFFDEVNVGSFCTPSGGQLGSALVTDDNGEITGTFAIPNTSLVRFRTGERIFRLTSSIVNSKGTSVTDDEVTTFAEGKYTARGMLQTKQNTIQSTRVPIIRSQSVTDTNVITTIDNVSVNATAQNIVNNISNVQETILASIGELDQAVQTNSADISNLTEELDNSNTLINANAENIQANSVNIETLDQQVQEQLAELNRMVQDIQQLTQDQINDLNAEILRMESENAELFAGFGNSIEAIQSSIRQIMENPASVLFGFNSRQIARLYDLVDPLAQTFLNNSSGGCFVTKVDLYFKSKDSNIPIKIYLTPTNAGRPTNTIIPFSEVIVNSSQVNVSDDASAVTTVTFPSPVYLEENKEYAIVLKPNSQKYEAYVSRLGQNEIGTTRRVTSQPLLGSLFRSQNARLWTEDQYEDLKFTMYKAQFTTNKTGNVDFQNNEITTDNLITNCFVTTTGANDDTDKIVTVLHKNHGMNNHPGTASKVTISIPSSVTGDFNGIPVSEFNGTHTILNRSATIPGVSSLDHYQIKLTTSANAAGNIGAAGITATREINFQVVQPQIGQLIFDSTKTEHYIKSTTIPGPYEVNNSSYSYNLDSSFYKIIPNDNYYYKQNRSVLSGINETEYLNGAKSISYRIGLFSTNKNLSPVVDINRTNLFAISNRLSNHVSGIDYNYAAETGNISGSAVAKYVTKEITLNNPSTALDIRLTASVASSSSVEVYYRTKLPEDTKSFNDINFVQLAVTNTPASSEQRSQSPYSSDFTTDFSEYQYLVQNLPEFVSFQIKIVMKGTNPAFPPRIRDMRGIALAL